MHHSPPLRADQQACWCVQAQQCHLPPPPQPGTQYMAHARGRGSMPGGRQPGRGCDPNGFVLVLGRIKFSGTHALALSLVLAYCC